MFIYWVSSNILKDNTVSVDVIDNIEYYLSTILNTDTKLATTAQLQSVTSPTVTKKYGLTRELCTAYYQTSDPSSLTGGYNKITRVCQETNPNAGLWLATTEIIRKPGEDILVHGPVLSARKVSTIPELSREYVMGVCIILSLLISMVIFVMFKHEPIFSLLSILSLITLSAIIIYG